MIDHDKEVLHIYHQDPGMFIKVQRKYEARARVANRTRKCVRVWVYVCMLFVKNLGFAHDILATKSRPFQLFLELANETCY